MDLYLLTQQWTKQDKCHMDNCVGLKSYAICYFNTFSCRCLRSGSNNMIGTGGAGVNDDLYVIFEHLGIRFGTIGLIEAVRAALRRPTDLWWQAATCGVEVVVAPDCYFLNLNSVTLWTKCYNTLQHFAWSVTTFDEKMCFINSHCLVKQHHLVYKKGISDSEKK